MPQLPGHAAQLQREWVVGTHGGCASWALPASGTINQQHEEHSKSKQQSWNAEALLSLLSSNGQLLAGAARML